MAKDYNNSGEKKHPVTYFLDGDLKTTFEKSLTANQILSEAGIDTKTNYLKWITGETSHSYLNKGDDAIQIHKDMKFISIFNGPTTVS